MELRTNCGLSLMSYSHGVTENLHWVKSEEEFLKIEGKLAKKETWAVPVR